MTTKIKGTEGVEFPDATKQATAADAGPTVLAQILSGVTFPANGAPTLITGPWTEVVDTNNAFSSSGRFQPTVAGYYFFAAQMLFGGDPANGVAISVNKNGGVPNRLLAMFGRAQNYAYWSTNVQGLMYLNGTTDYAELFIGATNVAATQVTLSDGGINFSAFLARRAAP